MKKIGFVGVYDKTDLLLNIAKVITLLGQKVLLVDSEVTQKARYIVPAVNPTISYITSFEDIDVAVGFNNENEIKKYLGISDDLPYDYILIDADTNERIEEFRIIEAEKNFFVTSFDTYYLKKGIEILRNLKQSIKLMKVYYAREILSEENEYLEYLSLGFKVEWDKERIYFPLENGDMSVLAENQRVQKIKFRKLSTQYKESLTFLLQQILDDKRSGDIKRIIKIVERGA